MKPVLQEGGLVLVVGMLLALAANQVSPRGLKLDRDYFPRLAVPPPTVPTNSSAAPPAAGQDAVAARLRAEGLLVIDHAATVALYRDPKYAEELIVFVDARDDAHYQAGHIPGAYQFDHYHPENYLATVFPACQNASRIVVYCTGGECEDSAFTAVGLHQAGIPLDKLAIYEGGITEWMAKGMPVELGTRRSGVLKEKQP